MKRNEYEKELFIDVNNLESSLKLLEQETKQYFTTNGFFGNCLDIPTQNFVNGAKETKYKMNALIISDPFIPYAENKFYDTGLDWTKEREQLERECKSEAEKNVKTEKSKKTLKLNRLIHQDTILKIKTEV